ncbi:MAG: polysaccharide biosynthesis/export family protein [Cyanobacteriota bacterium]|nr:polysaccharide biosynthesis/export family protein [Cyanobacteriota bacterium]
MFALSAMPLRARSAQLGLLAASLLGISTPAWCQVRPAATGPSSTVFPLPGDPQPPGPQQLVSPQSGSSLNRRANGFRYRLGPGDRLSMSVFKVDGYQAQVEVLPDGTINLPRLGAVEVWGLTLDEARQRITDGYDRILRRPIVTLDLVAPRPVRVTVTGEVQRPGFYTLSTQGNATSALTSTGPGVNTSTATVVTAGWPTLVDAIQKAGGMTALGDLSAISLTRPEGTPGLPPRTYRFDYLAVLREGGVATNPLIYDGDVITIAKAQAPISNEVLLRSAASTFAPDTITVNVVGEVMAPGPKAVRANSPLSSAVLAAGGITTNRGHHKNLKLMRLEADGKVSVASVTFTPGAPLGSPSNPPLRNGDVIVVDRNPWTKGNDFLGQAVAPLGPLLNAASLFTILGGF